MQKGIYGECNNPEKLKEVIGHKDCCTTCKYYAQYLPKDAKNATSEQIVQANKAFFERRFKEILSNG